MAGVATIDACIIDALCRYLYHALHRCSSCVIMNGVFCMPQELIGRPMYTELVEGESGQLKAQNDSAPADGLKKLIVDVSKH